MRTYWSVSKIGNFGEVIGELSNLWNINTWKSACIISCTIWNTKFNKKTIVFCTDTNFNAHQSFHFVPCASQTYKGFWKLGENDTFIIIVCRNHGKFSCTKSLGTCIVPKNQVAPSRPEMKIKIQMNWGIQRKPSAQQLNLKWRKRKKRHMRESCYCWKRKWRRPSPVKQRLQHWCRTHSQREENG